MCGPKDPSVMHMLAELSGEDKPLIADYTKYFDKVPKLAVAGVHNRKNAAAALAVADILRHFEHCRRKCGC